MDTAFTARCGCGRVTFASPRPPFLQLTCHCSQCRAVAKTDATDLAFFKAAEATVDGERAVHRFVADSGAATARETCAACGDAMFDRSDGFPKMLGVVAQRLAPPFEFRPRCHVWLHDKVADPVAGPGVALFDRGMA